MSAHFVHKSRRDNATIEATCYMHFNEYKRVKPLLLEIEKNRNCKVITELSDTPLTSKRTIVSFDKTYTKPDLFKVTINITSVPAQEGAYKL